MDVRNALIRSAEISIEDHGLLTAWVNLDFGGSGQGFGGYCLYVTSKSLAEQEPFNAAGHFITRCMEVAGVSSWKNMAGKAVRVRGGRSGIEAIGHIISDDWFNPGDDFRAVSANPVENHHIQP